LSDDASPLLNILVAFPYWTEEIARPLVRNAGRVRLVVDSGAFTAWKLGRPVRLDDYCRFLDTLPVKPWRYFTLDVIGDPAGSLRNYETMLQRGYRPVPIFTRGEDPSVLDDYYRSSDVVGIGGLVGTPGAKGFVNGILRQAADRRVHLLGFTQFDYLKYYKPYMCDASSWGSGARFGQMKLYLGKGRFARLAKADCVVRPRGAILEAVRSYGFDPTALATMAGWHGGYSVNRCLCGASAVRMSLEIQKHLGTLLFLAAGIGHEVHILLAGHEFETTGRRPALPPLKVAA
jgi:hypothetical protein